MKTLCFGSLNLDYTYQVDHMIRQGETLAALSMQTFCGGKGLNQAVALAKAGIPVWMAGCIGPDGSLLKLTLQAFGVNTEHVYLLDNSRTGHAIIQNDRNGDNGILLYGGANQEITSEMIDAVLAHFEGGDLLVLQNEISQIPLLMEKARTRGMKIAFTPAPITPEVKEYPLQNLDYLLFNHIEGSALASLPLAEPSFKEARVIVERLHEQLPHTVLICTLGSQGSMCMNPDGSVFVQEAFPVQTVDTTGAGDTFAGFFLACRMKEESIPESMKTAAMAAALSVQKPGASSSIPSLAAVQASLHSRY